MPAVTETQRLSNSDWFVIACITAWVFLKRYYVLSSDPLLAWPITDSIAHPERYSPQDLLIQAGATGNFLLYRLLAYLPLLGENLPLRDFLLYVPIYFLSLYAWWKVFTELGGSRPVVAFSLLLLVFSDDKLSLNWAHVLPPYFVSATSVQFLQVLGLLFFLRNRRDVALGITAASGYFHPASALSFGAVYAAIVCYDAIRNRSWRDTIPILVFGAIFLPNAIMIALNNQGAFAAPVEYFETFERYQPQAYPGDHFRMGYAYTLALMAFAYRYHTTRETGLSRKRDLFLFMAVGLLGSVVWMANLYAVKNLQAIHTFFPMRMFSLIHPLLVFLIVATTASLYASSKSLLDRAIATLFLLTPLYFFSPPAASIVVVSCAAFAQGRRWWPILFGASIAFYLGAVTVVHDVPLEEALRYLRNVGPGRVGNEFNWLQAGLLLISLLLIFQPARPIASPAASPGIASRHFLVVPIAIAAICSWTAFGRIKQANFEISSMLDFNPRHYWGVRASAPAYAELLDWVRQSPDRLFSIPPYNDRFLSFRYLSGKGVYVFHRDIAQLMYSPDFYLASVRRILELAGNAPDLPKAFMKGEVTRHNGEYESRCRALMESSRFEAIVFERGRLVLPECRNAPPVFQNETYVVFRTAEVRAQAARESR